MKRGFLHDRLWISSWIKSIYNELDITCHVFASQFSGHYDVITNRLWRHQQNVKRASVIYGSLCHVRNEIMYVLVWRTVYALTRVLFWCLFLPLLRNSEINTKITLSWAHKQFATRVHTLFSIYVGLMPPLMVYIIYCGALMGLDLIYQAGYCNWIRKLLQMSLGMVFIPKCVAHQFRQSYIGALCII